MRAWEISFRGCLIALLLLLVAVLFPNRAAAEPWLTATPLASNVATVPPLIASERTPQAWLKPRPADGTDQQIKRLKIAFVAAEALDVHSTLSAVSGDAREGNAVMRPLTGSAAAFLAVKAAATWVTLKAADRLAKKNKKGAAWLLGASSVALSAIAVHNYQTR